MFYHVEGSCEKCPTMSELEREAEDVEPNSMPRHHPEFAVANGPSYVRTLFFGSDGLRPGWGFAFYVIAFLLLQNVAVKLAWARDLGHSGLWSRMLEEVLNFLVAAIPATVLARIEGRRWHEYGLPLRQTLGLRFWIGMVWGFLSISLVMFAIYEGRGFSPGHVVLHGMHIVRFAAFWGIYFLFVGLFEDFLFRGYSQFTLARGIGFWPAAVLLACTFGLIHRGNTGENWTGMLLAGLVGLFFCFTLRRTGSLWFAIGFHASWDWGETFFYSVPDSGMVEPGHLLSSSLQGPRWLTGGSVGPEGSVFCFIVILLVWLVFDRIYPATATPAAVQSK